MKEKLLRDIIEYLINEGNFICDIPNSLDDRRRLYKTLVNIREPKSIDERILRLEDEYLTLEVNDKKITDVSDLTGIDENIILWQGDITTLKCDVIVNAGNNDGLGCFNPDHKCIDNIIHTNAGMRLRLECNDILNGSRLENGNIIVCDGYNLPCKKVITTVGPQVCHDITLQDEIDLYRCYRNALVYAILHGYKSIAFPSISTGLFGYPISLAKVVALRCVNEVLDEYDTDIKVIFDLYSKEDYDEYRKMFKD